MSKPEWSFSATEYDQEISYEVAYFPVGKELSADADASALPEAIHILSAALCADNAVLDADVNEGNHLAGTFVPLRTAKSAISSANIATAKVSLITLKMLGDLFVELPMGAQPDVGSPGPASANSVGDVRIEGTTSSYSLEGKKTKKLGTIEVKVFIKNTGKDRRFLMLCLAATDGDSEHRINTPSGIYSVKNSSGDTAWIEPGQTLKVEMTIYSPENSYGECGQKLPAVSELPSTTLHPFIRIFSPEVGVETTLSNPSIE
jgi:hypothetical protein